MKFFPLALIGLLVLPTACIAYREAPLDLQRDSAAWRQLSAQLCPPGQRLTRAQMLHIGLLLNPELNKARLGYAKSTAVARYAGLWQDPVFSADVQHVMRQNLTNYTIAPALTIPVTGLPRLARQVAEQYRESDYERMVAQEHRFVRDADIQLSKLMVAHRKMELAEAELAAERRDKQRMAQLRQSGEVSVAEAQLASQRLLDTEKEYAALGQQHAEAHAQLVAMLGLHPDARRMEFVESLPEGVPSAVPVPTPAQLAELPELKAELAAYGATETEFKAEIRKQYPELTFGPERVHEDGEDKVGGSLELSIPLWNRNREAIAKAAGDRSLQQQQTIAAWRSLQQETAALGDAQQLGLEDCRRMQDSVRSAQEAEQRQAALQAIGETTLSESAQARYESYRRRLDALELLGGVLETQASLKALNPSYEP